MRARQSRPRASYDLNLSFYQVGSFCTIWNDYKEFFFLNLFTTSLSTRSKRYQYFVIKDTKLSVTGNGYYFVF